MTLVEALIALLLASVILTLVVQASIRTLTLLRRSGEDLEQTYSIVTLLEDLESDLRAALSATATEEGKLSRPVLRLVTTSPGQRSPLGWEGSRFEITYRSRRGKSRPPRAVVIRETRRRADATLLEQRSYRIDVQRLDLKPWPRELPSSERRGWELRLTYLRLGRVAVPETAHLLVEVLAAGEEKQR